MSSTSTTTRGIHSNYDRANYYRIFTFFSGYRIACAAVLLLCGFLPAFDASHHVISPTSTSTSLLDRFISTTVRWDTFHYLEIARSGYHYEHLFAFLPGTPTVMRMASAFSVYDAQSIMLWGSWVVILLCSTTKTLYDLTLEHTHSRDLAVLATVSSIFTTSPATLLHAPYSEPFFAFLSFRGMLYSSRRMWLKATLMFSVASLFRSNGVILSGYIIWGILLEPLRRTRIISITRIGKAMLYCIMIVSPLLLHQASGYVTFCQVPDSPSWCKDRFPLIYSSVQAKYWGVGLFKYWEVAQLPNFLLAAPSLAVIIWAAIIHMRRKGIRILMEILNGLNMRNLWVRKNISEADEPIYGFLSEGITPYAIHALVLSFILIINSHIQIVLRLSSSLPFTHWAAAQLWIEKPSLARWWTGWTIVWGLISLTTWGLFLPPA
ncbi:mannosyltransferase [Serendipita vermifera]|nr:mannosyltransferase [Serendipita vermifera]